MNTLYWIYRVLTDPETSAAWFAVVLPFIWVYAGVRLIRTFPKGGE